jgi:hypothetical protein
MIPLYKEPKNSPFVPGEEKDIRRKAFMDKKIMEERKSGEMETNPLVNFQVYEPKIKPRDTSKARSFLPLPAPNPWTIAYPNMQPQFPGQQASGPFYPTYPTAVPIIKNYQINTAGPQGDHVKLSAIYEDVLPKKEFNSTLNTLGERLSILEFVRSIFINYQDGENISLDGKSKNSLLSYLKFIELNPYRKYSLTNNPYKDLPLGMLLYRCCYPIRYDQNSASITCAKGSIGMNIRIYNLSSGACNTRKNNARSSFKFDEWREIGYYEYIRERIIKNKQSPNFVSIYCHYLSEDCGIDFNKLARIRREIENVEPSFIKKVRPSLQSLATKLGDKLDDVEKARLKKREYTPLKMEGGMWPQIGTDPSKPIIDMEDNPDSISGNALIVLTEAPTYSLLGWTIKTYENQGNIRRMIHTGYHDDDTWISVLFQIAVACYVLQVHEIAFYNFSIENNVYIRDLNNPSPGSTYWIYQVDGMNYYIPNYGSLALIDTDFRDLPKSGKKMHKIYGNFYGTEKWDPKELKENMFRGFTQCLSPNNYSKVFTNQGGTKPPEKIIKFLSLVYSDISKPSHSTNIGDYVYKHFRMFLHNRIGTYLKDTELANIRRDDPSPYSKGQLVVREVGRDTYKWVMYIKPADGINQSIVLSKSDSLNDDIIEKTVANDSLINYYHSAPLEQKMKTPSLNFNEDNLLETYSIYAEK